MQNTNTVGQSKSSAATHKINGKELPNEKAAEKQPGNLKIH